MKEMFYGKRQFEIRQTFTTTTKIETNAHLLNNTL